MRYDDAAWEGTTITQKIKSEPFGWPFLALVGLLCAALVLGGSSRADLPTLMVLRPLAALVLGYALWGLRGADVRAHPWLLAGAAAMIALPLVQLVPLPPSIWRALPGRELIAQVDAIAGVGDVWRPISLVPSATWNAFFSLLVPLAVLILGLRLNRAGRARLVPALLIAGFCSALLGVLQILGPRGGPLYFYSITHDDSAVGLFANRNHHAAVLACMFPALALFATTRTETRLDGPWKPWLALAGAVLLVPLILVTGSRAGLVSGVLGIVLAGLIAIGPLLKSRALAPRIPAQAIVAGVAVLGGLLAWATTRLGRAEALDRLLHWESDNDFRLRAWQPILDLVHRYFPVGTGFGSFAKVYEVNEPRELLHSTYFNQAHNDWIEVLLTGGLPAALLLAAVCLAVLWRIVVLSKQIASPSLDDRLGWLGLSIIIIMAFASSTDYPLRVPSIACIWVIAAIWAAPHARDASTRRPSGDTTEPNMPGRPALATNK